MGFTELFCFIAYSGVTENTVEMMFASLQQSGNKDHCIGHPNSIFQGYPGNL